MTRPDITYSPHDGVAEITLQRPERLNALTPGMAQALLDAVRQAQADPAVRVLLLQWVSF